MILGYPVITSGKYRNEDSFLALLGEDSDEEERYKNEEELHAKIDELFARGLIETEAMNFIRGRSFVNTYLDEQTNGLSYASEHMKKSPFCYQITFNAEECERSELAMDAIQRM